MFLYMTQQCVALMDADTYKHLQQAPAPVPYT